jgi:ribulose-phosphate 3-epimerase
MLSAKIAPSILSCDFAHLAQEAQRMENAKAHTLHVDVMDGHFVPNITLGAPVVKSLRQHTKMFIDCHLMVTNPEQWVDDFAAAGADNFTFHIEAAKDAASLIKAIKAKSMKVGIAIKPGTDVEALFPYCNDIDMALVMTVEPGFGGQKLIQNCLEKAKILRTKFPELDIQVDGGVDVTNIEQVAQAGYNVIVSGTGIFKHKDPAQAIAIMTTTVNKYLD